MRIRNLAIFLLAAFPPNTNATDLLACIDTDVMEALVSRGARAEYQITDQLPIAFADLQIPEELSFIGTEQSLKYWRAAFRSDKEPAQAAQLLEEPLKAQGWSTKYLPMSRSQRRGFQEAPATSHSQIILCDADNVSLSVSARENDQGSYVFLSKSASSRGNLCNAARYGDPYEETEFTNAVTPNLYLPEDAEQMGSGWGGMIRSSGDDAETHIRLVTRKSADEIHSYFSVQLSEQGWISDSSWAGQLVSGSSWILDKKEVPTTAGTLVVLEHGAGDYTAQFTMIAL